MSLETAARFNTGRRRRTQLALSSIGLALLITACGDSSSESDGAAEAPITSTTVTEVPDLAAPATSAAPTTAIPVPTTATPTTTAAPTTTTKAPPLAIEDDVVTIDWSALGAEPFYSPASGGGDPFFHIHTAPETDGFFLSLEMYTTGYGQEWTGETGTFDISCDDASSSTGICPYFDVDGPGPDPVKGSDFMTTGSLTIIQLDGDGYEIVVHELTFSDGTTFDEFTIRG